MSLFIEVYQNTFCVEEKYCWSYMTLNFMLVVGHDSIIFLVLLIALYMKHLFKIYTLT